MNILLLQPPISDFYQTKVRLQPLGLAYLKSTAQQIYPHINIEIRDLQSGYKRKTIQLPKSLNYLKDYYGIVDNSPFSSFHHFYHFGATDDEIIKLLQTKKWDLIGISTLFTPYYSDVIKLITLIKKNVSSPVVLGGGHASAVFKQLMLNENIDFIIRGEGEKPFIELIEALQNNRPFTEVSNLSHRGENKQVIHNPNKDNYHLDQIPFPNLKELGLYKYQFQKRPIAFMLTSRSCPHQCSFCSAFQVFGRRYRKRSNENILQEIHQRFLEGYKVIDFEDDNLTFDKKKSLQLFNEITKRKYDIELMAMNGISYHELDHELLFAMKAAGFKSINISLVSSDNITNQGQKRFHNDQQFDHVVKTAFSLKMSITSYIILGLPIETLEQMANSIIRLATLPVLIGASPFYLIPETPIAKLFTDVDFGDFTKCRLTAMAFTKEPFKRDDLYTLFITCRIINFIKSFPTKNEIDIFKFLKQKHDDQRMNQSTQMLIELLEKKKWHQPRFKLSTFNIIWQKLDYIKTQRDITIFLHK